jgi:hypothetical protein
MKSHVTVHLIYVCGTTAVYNQGTQEVHFTLRRTQQMYETPLDGTKPLMHPAAVLFP